MEWIDQKRSDDQNLRIDHAALAASPMLTESTTETPQVFARRETLQSKGLHMGPFLPEYRINVFNMKHQQNLCQVQSPLNSDLFS